MSKNGANAAAGRWEGFLSLSPRCCLPPSFPCTPACREMPCPALGGREGGRQGGKEGGRPGGKEGGREAAAPQRLHLGGAELGGGLRRAAGPAAGRGGRRGGPGAASPASAPGEPCGGRRDALGGCCGIRRCRRIY